MYKFTIKIKGKNVQNPVQPPEVPQRQFTYTIKKGDYPDYLEFSDIVKKGIFGNHKNIEFSYTVKGEREANNSVITGITAGEQPGSREFSESIKGPISELSETIKGVELDKLDTIKKNGPPEFSESIKRECLSCGRDITNQKGNSMFCGAKYVGEKQAHQCRNQNSNQRNNFKRKVETITRRGVLFDITPFLVKTSTTNSFYKK
ncbi:MAG: hypothetical protein Q8M29_11535 [Bacteroidota bacterium]|nr:hypothetical protein [Bacteroidota bacterium]